ncbi:MAG: hypothetical protein AAGA48_16890 [Myxococcota bacterium]
MATDLPAIPVEAFFRRASWQCARTTDMKAVAAALDLPHLEPAATPEDLRDVDPATMPCLIVSDGEWTWVFGNAMGLKGARRLSTEFGEALAFHADDDSDTHLAERAIRGQSERRVYASRRDHEYVSHGPPSTSEPRVNWLDEESDAAELGLTSADVLHFARAWGVDPQGVLTRKRSALWATRRTPHAEPPPKSVRSSIASTVMFVVATLLLVASIGVLVGFNQPEVAAEVCDQHVICASCVSCVAAEPHPCASLHHDCDEDAGCRDLLACFDGCLDLRSRTGLAPPPDDAPACFDACRTTHADGLEAYCAWSACAYDDACAAPCAAPTYRALAACELD